MLYTAVGTGRDGSNLSTNLGPYMDTLGMSSFVIPLIKGMSQVVTFETLENQMSQQENG